MRAIKNAMSFAAACCLLLVSCAFADQPLLPQSQRLFPVDGNDWNGGVDHPWLSGHELLHYKADGRVFRYDLVTKTDTALPALTHQVKTSRVYLAFLDASPDGRWVLWGKSANNRIFVASADGARCFSSPGNGGMSEPYWCGDGEHWLQFLFTADAAFSESHPKVRFTEVILHSVDAPNLPQAIPTVPEGLQGLDVLGAVSADEVIARIPDAVQFLKSKPLKSAFSNGQTAFTFEEKQTFRKTQRISVWSLHQGTPLHRWTVRLPGLVREVAVSPDGQWAAWLVDSQAALHRKDAGRIRSALWISRIDGSQMKEIGFADAGSNVPKRKRMSAAQMEQAADAFPVEVRWSPDDKRLSFLCEGALWTVPAH